VPIIAIFTKYDKLVDYIKTYEKFEGLDEEAEARAKEARAREKLEEICAKPFREQIAGKTKIPDIPVSSECVTDKEGFEF
jgi:hypothetical protein